MKIQISLSSGKQLKHGAFILPGSRSGEIAVDFSQAEYKFALIEMYLEPKELRDGACVWADQQLSGKSDAVVRSLRKFEAATAKLAKRDYTQELKSAMQLFHADLQEAISELA